MTRSAAPRTGRTRSPAAATFPATRPGAHYRNCWWVDDPGLPFYHASGINGQHIFVHVPSQTVVAKLSTWPTALSPSLEATVAGRARDRRGTRAHRLTPGPVSLAA